MSDKSGTPSGGSDRLVGTVIKVWLVAVIVILTVIVSTLLTGCSVPAEGGSETHCQWERERVKRSSSSLTHVNLTRTYLQAGFKPRPPVSRPKGGGIVKPNPRRSYSVRTVKPHKPYRSPGKGYRWEYDCD